MWNQLPHLILGINYLPIDIKMCLDNLFKVYLKML